MPIENYKEKNPTLYKVVVEELYDDGSVEIYSYTYDKLKTAKGRRTRELRPKWSSNIRTSVKIYACEPTWEDITDSI